MYLYRDRISITEALYFKYLSCKVVTYRCGDPSTLTATLTVIERITCKVERLPFQKRFLEEGYVHITFVE